MAETNVGAKAASALRVLVLVCPLFLAPSAWADSKPYTMHFGIEGCTFSDTGRNPYFSLNPGDYLRLEGDGVVLEISVLPETRVIHFETVKGFPMTVTTRVIEERETQDGALVEVSHNFYARCQQTNDVIYFGEEVTFFEAGGTNHAGSWLAGDNAFPGLIMPGTFLIRSRYFQELAKDVAQDRAEHVTMGLQINTKKATFEDCIEVFETTPLEPSSRSTKRYCPGVGLVFDDGLELVDYRVGPS